MKTPEELAEEWARDWHKDCDYPEEILKHTIKATKTTFLAGYEAATPQWISVKERLPEDHNYYFVTSKNEPFSTSLGFFPAGSCWHMDIAYFHKKNEAWMTGEVALNCKDENKVRFVVSHWMPLPELPEDAKE